MQPPNAAHHAPAGPIENLNSRRVAGRVHALVRHRPALTPYFALPRSQLAGSISILENISSPSTFCIS